MAIEFDATDFENTRKAIDVSLTADALPNDVISLDIYKGEAVSQIESAVAALSAEQKTAQAAAIKRAAVLLTAAFIAPKIKVLTSETIEGDKFTFQQIDLAKIASDLETRAFGVVGRILNEVLEVPTPTASGYINLFTTAKANPK
jgi:hypothetical protein